jgi:hypothetical protein
LAPALLARFPRLHAPPSRPVIPPEARSIYPRLAADLDALERDVAPVFRELDEAALRDQNRYRRQQVSVILGAVVVAGLGSAQAVLPEQHWPGLLLTVLGILLAAGSRWAHERASQTEYLNARVKAERLRALHFRYLSRTGPYAHADRELALRRAVVAVRAGREPA